MEVTYENVGPRECTSWGDDELYLDPAFWDDTGALLSNNPAPDILDATAGLAPDLQFNEFDLDLVSHRQFNEFGFDPFSQGSWEPIGHNQRMDLAFEPTSATITTLGSSQSDSIWSPSPGESAFKSPLASTSTPSLTPDFFTWQSPQSTPDTIFRFPTVTTAPLINNMSEIAHCITEAPALEYIQEPLPQTAATPLALTMEDRPPGVSSYVPPCRHDRTRVLKLTCTHRREWRNKIKPAQCPGCPKTFPFNSGDRKKHIAARHPELAAEYGVSTERPECKWCHDTFARLDGLERHLKNKHGG